MRGSEGGGEEVEAWGHVRLTAFQMGGFSCVFAVLQLSAVTYVATGSDARRDRIISTVPFSTASGAMAMGDSVTWSLPKSEKAPAESFQSCYCCCSGCQRQSVPGFDLLHPING